LEDDVARTFPHGLADRGIQAVAVLTVSGLAALAAWISYHHMLTLAEQADEHGIDAHAFPLTVDGLDVIGMLVLLADRRNGRRSGPLPYTILCVGTLASITANIAVAPDNLVARAISGWTAIALLAAAKMLAHLFEPTHTTTARANNQDEASPSAATEPPSVDESQRPPDPVARRHASRQWRDRYDTARRLPTTDITLSRWRTIWHATRHLDTATRETAAQHGVSLRTLQFIRAAGEDGHLTDAHPTEPPTPPPPGPTPESEPATQELQPNGELTSAVT
jgi:hypothetical protein